LELHGFSESGLKMRKCLADPEIVLISTDNEAISIKFVFTLLGSWILLQCGSVDGELLEIVRKAASPQVDFVKE
jgi:hypothetical protein